MAPFVRAVEVWLPDADGLLLEHGGGLYGGASDFARRSHALCFGRGEGLPGLAWETGAPVLLPTLASGGVFRRAAAAEAAGYACAVALPSITNGRLGAVTVLLCGAPAASRGAIELWHNDPRTTADLRLHEGLFGAAAEELATLSQDAFLPRGSGLPGLAWQREAAVFLDRVHEHRAFLRGPAAAAAGVVHGLALPCDTTQVGTWVLSLLSAPGQPIARRIESWQVDPAAARMALNFGFCAVEGSLAPLPALPLGSALAAALDGPIGRARAEARAVVASGAGLNDPCTASARALGCEGVLALPVCADGVAGEVLAIYL